MNSLLVCYDVSTESKEGKNRLRRVAHLCVAHGSRVQNSVFECTLTSVQLESFRENLLKVIDREEDSLRIYRIQPSLAGSVEIYGVDRGTDFRGPLIF